MLVSTGKLCSPSVLLLSNFLRKVFMPAFLLARYIHTLTLSVSMVCSAVIRYNFSNTYLCCSLPDAIHHSWEPSRSTSNNCACEWYQCFITEYTLDLLVTSCGLHWSLTITLPLDIIYENFWIIDAYIIGYTFGISELV